MKQLAFAALAALVALAATTACSGGRHHKGDNAEAVEAASNQLNQALAEGDMRAVSQLADSMALYVDDLAPDEVVTVLLAFVHTNNEADGRDLETQRKFVDVYDIATGNNPRDMERAFDRARRLNPDVDFPAIAKDYRRNLAEYDAIQTYGEPEPDDAAADSAAVAADSIPKPLAD